MNNSKKNFIGILGGTFDPPHMGHIFISNYALIKLGLGEIWWIVTAKNPLKKNSTSYGKRFLNTKNFLMGSKIKILEIEDIEKNIYTVDVVLYLKKKFPKKKFIWIMGVDNLEKFHLWKDWKKIFSNIPIAIFDRPFYSLYISKSKAIGFFRDKRIKITSSKKLKYMTPPKWVFIRGVINAQSSTRMRSKIDESKF